MRDYSGTGGYSLWGRGGGGSEGEKGKDIRIQGERDVLVLSIVKRWVERHRILNVGGIYDVWG